MERSACYFPLCSIHNTSSKLEPKAELRAKYVNTEMKCIYRETIYQPRHLYSFPVFKCTRLCHTAQLGRWHNFLYYSSSLCCCFWIITEVGWGGGMGVLDLELCSRNPPGDLRQNPPVEEGCCERKIGGVLSPPADLTGIVQQD